MFIITSGHYIPSLRIPNSHFMELNGLSGEWILSRTGIRTRSKTSADENTHTMALAACDSLFEKTQMDTNNIDLIVGGTYTPHDTLATLAHSVQHHLQIEQCKSFTLSSACSSFVNAMEIVESFFISGKASLALVIISENNSAYNDECDEKSGHLWGDGAVAFLVSKTRTSDKDTEVLQITSQGLGHLGKGPDGVYLRPTEDGLRMPYGKDVFVNACKYMAQNTENILKEMGYKLADLNYLVPHQANLRIVNNIAQELQLSPSKILTNLEELGNTGSASAPLCYSQNKELFKQGDLVVLSVFGGGYSAGAILLKV